MSRSRFAEWVHRHRLAIFAVWWIHVILMHYLFLGYISWDGFGYRGLSVVELAQHGALDKLKYAPEWSLAGYIPFVELVQVPFLKLFGMTGFLLGFPLVVMPFSVWAVRACVQELTDDPIAGTFAAIAFALMPMVNQQPFSGYIDFCVPGLLAFLVFAVLRVAKGEASRWRFPRLALASLLFTMARVQALYVGIIVVGCLAYALFCERERFRITMTNRGRLLALLAVALLAAVPAIAFGVWRYREFGSPTFPLEMKLFGLKIGTGGYTRTQWYEVTGIGGDSWSQVARGFFDGWIWHWSWPLSGFYSSRFLAAGLLFDLALLMVPFVARDLTRTERWMLLGCAVVSLLTRDLGVPRYSYTTSLAFVLVFGRGCAKLAKSTGRRARIAFWIVAAITSLHMLRPELDYLQLRHQWVSPHLNASGNKHYLHGVTDLAPFPDIHGKFVIIDYVANGFMLPVYGHDLENEVIACHPSTQLGPHCEQLLGWLFVDPEILFIDDNDATKACKRECAIPTRWACRAWRILPP